MSTSELHSISVIVSFFLTAQSELLEAKQTFYRLFERQISTDGMPIAANPGDNPGSPRAD